MIEAGGKLGPRPNPWRFVHFVLLSTNDHHATSLCLGGKIVAIRSMVSDEHFWSIQKMEDHPWNTISVITVINTITEQQKSTKESKDNLPPSWLNADRASTGYVLPFDGSDSTAAWGQKQWYICNDFRKLYNHLSSTLVFETDTLPALLTICEFSHLEHQVNNGVIRRIWVGLIPDQHSKATYSAEDYSACCKDSYVLMLTPC